jgi:1,4-alpha-glucan branching enzyme
MEMMHIKRSRLLQGIFLCIGILLSALHGTAQPILKKYSIKDNRMVIELSKHLPEKELDDFIRSYELSDLDLKTFIRTNKPDSLQKLGWRIEQNSREIIVLSKALFSFDMMSPPSERIIFAEKIPAPNDIKRLNTAEVRYGYNRFRNKYPFRVQDSVVMFFLKNNKRAGKVMLAGSFSNWERGAFTMTLTDSGWIAYVKLGTGKHWYKFIVDGQWMTDPDNQLNENDEDGNTNSVYYKTNHTFRLNGFTNAKRVYLAGSFNDWHEKEMLMTKTLSGWELPVLLPEGTHTYKFVVDGDWYADPINSEKLPDGAGGYNSVIRFGATHIFKLDGHTNATHVKLSGSFNGWKEEELEMKKTATGWELPYVLGPGNYEYKFIVDGKWISDPSNSLKGNDDNSFIVISPNYTFKLKAPNAKQVILSGDFNGWNPNAIPMKKQGDTWTFSLYLAPGKHQYKFVVDGEWVRDPANKLWEQNEYGTGNSIVWIGQK